jgi:NADH-quinone oxidoreductase subunit J
MSTAQLFADAATASTPEISSTSFWHLIFFLLYAGVACGMALAVLFTSNIVRMAFYLTISLGAVAGLFILAGAHFVGAMQLLIYVGGTLVLLIFGVMLTAQAQFIEMRTRGGEWVLAAIVGGSLLTVLLFTAMAVPAWRGPGEKHLASIEKLDVEVDSTSLGAGLVGLRPEKLSQKDEQLQAGMSGYFFPFEIVSMHLLVVLIGAAYLARARHRVERIAVRAGPLPTPRRRNLFVAGVLVLATIAHVVCAATCFLGEAWIRDRVPLARNLEPWAFTWLGVCCIVEGLLLLVILGWQKWGCFATCATTLIAAGLLYGAGAPWYVALAALAAGGVWLVVLFGLLKIGGPRSMWAQME